jgi:site-specific DNA-methyltransferase (adenine-specific)
LQKLVGHNWFSIKHASAKEWLASISRDNEDLVSLIYADLPFFTQYDFYKEDTLAFSDKWASRQEYLDWITSLLPDCARLLGPGGSFVLHCDPRISHHIKVALDSFEWEGRFASEIIWRYRRWPTKTANFQRVHDVLLRYVCGAPPIFNQLYEPLAPSTLKSWGRGKQQAQYDEQGNRTRSKSTEAPSPGVPLGDVWDDIGILAPSSPERTGYPTQKPAALLERLILSLTRPDDLVLDFCFGSGTTIATALKLGRNAVGCDRSPVAYQTAKERLEKT